MNPNNFGADLLFSHACEDLACWKEIYTKAFPTMQAMVSHRQDGQHQRAGIDRTIVLENGKSVTVDEKVRREDYGDILIEYVANDRTSAPGWAEKHLLCDFIAYAILPTGKAYLLPVIQLQTAWRKNKDDWLTRSTLGKPTTDKPFKLVKASNPGYTTYSLGVPIKVLFGAIGDALRVDFSAEVPTNAEEWR